MKNAMTTNPIGPRAAPALVMASGDSRRMITTLLIAVAILAAPVGIICRSAEPVTNAVTDEGWELVWRDEFDGTTIDSSKWQHEVNARGGGNNELQYYTARPENSRVTNGVLVIETRRENYTDLEGTRQYTSARLRTRRKADWKYGRFEIRAKLPAGKGIWPAIWLLPRDNTYGGWPVGGEIDIMESVGHEPGRVHGTLHYADDAKGHLFQGAYFDLPQGNFAEDFHVFRLDWEPNEFRWYVDGKLYQTQTNWHTRKHEFPAPFDQNFYLVLNTAVGGNWPGNPDATTAFPQQFVIDYVRVFQRKK